LISKDLIDFFWSLNEKSTKWWFLGVFFRITNPIKLFSTMTLSFAIGKRPHNLSTLSSCKKAIHSLNSWKLSKYYTTQKYSTYTNSSHLDKKKTV
jgi:hypothetical protein